MTLKTKVTAALAGAAAAVCAFAAPASAATVPVTFIAPAGTANPNGSATVGGTVSCPVGYTVYGHANVYQGSRFGQGIWLHSTNPIPCTGVPQPWSATTGPAGFVAGAATVYAFLCTAGQPDQGCSLTRAAVVLV
jgi:hypothetical protein